MEPRRENKADGKATKTAILQAVPKLNIVRKQTHCGFTMVNITYEMNSWSPSATGWTARTDTTTPEFAMLLVICPLVGPLLSLPPSDVTRRSGHSGYLLRYILERL
jgi:hypothetical protein